MYLFAKGIFVNANIHLDQKETLFEPDALLQQCIPQYDMIETLYTDKQKITTTKKAINAAIMQAVQQDRIDIARLHPKSIEYTHMDFDRIRDVMS
jgi:hypothetical protein